MRDFCVDSLMVIKNVVLEVISSILNVPEKVLQDNPILTTHQWDSIISLDALIQLENKFKIKFDLRKFHAVRTIDDIAELISNTQEN